MPKSEGEKAASAVGKTEKSLREIVTFDYFKFNLALENDDKETCKKILDEIKHKNPINSYGGTALHDAAWTGNAKMFKTIVSRRFLRFRETKIIIIQAQNRGT